MLFQKVQESCIIPDGRFHLTFTDEKERENGEKNHSSRRQSTCKPFDTIKYPAHVCYVWCICTGSFYVWDQSCDRITDERCRHTALHSDHQRQSSCLSRFQLRISVPGTSCSFQVWLSVCPGRFRSPWYLRHDRCPDHPPVWNKLDRHRTSNSCHGTCCGSDRAGACRKCSQHRRASR